MASATAAVNFSSTLVVMAKASDSPKSIRFSRLNEPWKRSGSHWAGQRVACPMSTNPDLSEKIAESIKEAEDLCAGDPSSGECVAAWDEVEELSAAISHAKDKMKVSDPLEEFCKDNMETDECRTYED